MYKVNFYNKIRTYVLCTLLRNSRSRWRGSLPPREQTRTGGRSSSSRCWSSQGSDRHLPLQQFERRNWNSNRKEVISEKKSKQTDNSLKKSYLKTCAENLLDKLSLLYFTCKCFISFWSFLHDRAKMILVNHLRSSYQKLLLFVDTLKILRKYSWPN